MDGSKEVGKSNTENMTAIRHYMHDLLSSMDNRNLTGAQLAMAELAELFRDVRQGMIDFTPREEARDAYDLLLEGLQEKLRERRGLTIEEDPGPRWMVSDHGAMRGANGEALVYHIDLMDGMQKKIQITIRIL